MKQQNVDIPDKVWIVVLWVEPGGGHVAWVARKVVPQRIVERKKVDIMHCEVVCPFFHLSESEE